MHALFTLIAFLLPLASASAAYDSSWYQTEFWSGEYPTGFAVVKQNVAVLGRTGMDKNQPANIRCMLPYKAVFQLWNRERNSASQARYFTASKIVPMVAKEDFLFDDGQTKLSIKKGETIEWLIYNGEGQFSARIRGKEYAAQQDLLEHVEKPSDSAFTEDKWLSLRCENGVSAWLFFDDLVHASADGETQYAPGIGDWGPGLVEYGKTHDLP